MTQPAKQSGAWIFVSHSHKDLEKVREIRNELEKRGHNPLLFYLKCMDDDQTLLPDLIRREIKAREWFILCDSPNAQASKWVQDEMALIRSMAHEGKVIETVDLSQSLQTELHKLVKLSKRATVFLSYANHDIDTAKRIEQALLKHDFAAWTPHTNIRGGDNYPDAISKAIEDAATQGVVLVLLSTSALQSASVIREVAFALRRSAQSARNSIIPIRISDFDPSRLPPNLRDLSYFDLTTGSSDERIEELILSLKTRELE